LKGNCAKKWWPLAIVAICLTMLLSPEGFAQQKPLTTLESPASKPSTGQRVRLSYVTNPAGTGYYTIAVAQGQLLSRKSNITVVVQPSSGPLAIPGLVGNNEAQLGISAASTLYHAYSGTMDFNKPHPFARVLQSGHDSFYAFITSEKTGIKAIPDLKKRRVTIDFPTARLLRELATAELQAYGLSLPDVTVRKSEFTDKALEDLFKGTTDAVMATLSGAKMPELDTKMKMRALPFDPNRIGSLQKRLPAMYAEMTPERFPVLGGGIWVVATPALLWAHQNLPEDLAYVIVKTLNENSQEIVSIHSDLKGWAPNRAVRPLPMPYHPGAIRYYKETARWSEQMDVVQTGLTKH
jgi:uncharacterized protein